MVREARRRAIAIAAIAVLGVLARPVRTIAQDEAATEAAKFSAAQLEQLVAPIALYPDGLAVQVLIAATYPLEIVEAARWRAKNPSLRGDALDKALEGEDWDPSVEALARFPELLQRMSDNLDWTKDLGDAFLAQKDDVLDTVQRMRAKAYESGALKTTEQQVVTREVVKEKEIIKVEPANPEVVSVPQYSPTAVYGSYPTPYYPTMMAYPPGYVATTSLLSFGAGMAVGAAVWGDCDWDHHDVYHDGGGGGGKNQNVNYNKNVDRSRTRVEGGNRQKWQHNPERRGGVRYRDQGTAKKYGGRDQVAARDRARQDVARGYDRNQAGGGRGAGDRGSRPGASTRPAGGRGDAGGRQPGGLGGGERGGGASSRPGGGARPQPRDNAFGGYESSRSARDASARGASSRGRPSYAGGGGGGRGGYGGGGYGGGGRGGGGRGGGFGGGGGRGGGRGGGGRGGGGRGGRR